MGRRRYATEKLPPLVGAKEVIEILDVGKMTFGRWRAGDDPYFDVPQADPGPSQGPVWVRQDVLDWKEANGRQRAAAG